ncbi:MAG: ParB N-terminal domain-containing protein [Pseudomonadota bacterium]
MARKRLTPATPAAATVTAEVPPGAPETKSLTRLSGTAPIAHVAGDASAQAALRDLSTTLAEARATGRMIVTLPLEAVAEDHLTRDRIALDPEEMAALETSLEAHGQRTPIEVTERADGRHGLISGLRRLTALRSLHARTQEARFATVQALVRRPDSAAEAYVAMVEENEIRADLSYYERARIAARSVEDGVFRDEKEALQALFATASRAKRSKIRSFLEIYRALDGHLRFPAHLPERLGLRLVTMIREGEASVLTSALRREAPESPEAEQEVLARMAAPLPKKHARPAYDPGRVELIPGVTVEAKRGRKSLTLRLKGPGLDAAAQQEILAHLKRLRRPV